MESNKERLQNLISSINEKQAEALCIFLECMTTPNQPKPEEVEEVKIYEKMRLCD